jgi:hypothetical protein
MEFPARCPSAPGPLDQPGGLHCYACGRDYDYLGDGRHEGRCPACDSPAVPPAGDLRVTSDPEPVGSWAGDGVVHRVDAVDATGRRFGYWLSTLPGDRAQLVGVDVDGVGVGPGDDDWPARLPALVPDWLDSVLDVAGLTLVAPDAVVE